jgi:precorrin-3B C17-methyltransferase
MNTTHNPGKKTGKITLVGLGGWLASIVASGKSVAELAAEYRLPEDYIAAVLADDVPADGEAFADAV